MAYRQHGVVARRQLERLGLGRSAIDYRVAAGRLHPVHRGVYAVGHRRLGVHGRWLAAVLACGPGALSSHRSAAALWELLPTARPSVDVVAKRSRERWTAGATRPCNWPATACYESPIGGLWKNGTP